MEDTKSTKSTIEIRFTISKELHKELKMMAVQDDTTLQKLLPVLISAGMAHHSQFAQGAQSSTQKPKRIERTKGTKSTKSTVSTKGTEVAVVPLDKRT